MGSALPLVFIFFAQAFGGTALSAQSSLAQLTVSQKQYRSDALIQFTLVNTSRDVIYLPSPAPWTVWRGDDVVYEPNAPGELVTLLSGEGLTWEVARGVSEFGDLSKAGRYEIHLLFYDADLGTHELESAFILIGP